MHVNAPFRAQNPARVSLLPVAQKKCLHVKSAILNIFHDTLLISFKVGETYRLSYA